MKPMHLTKESFDSEARVASLPVLIDFYADWCGPCKMLAPVIEEIAAEAGGYLVGKVNVDEAPELAEEFRVMSIPTLIVFKNGKPVRQTMGVQPKAAILDLLNDE